MGRRIRVTVLVLTVVAFLQLPVHAGPSPKEFIIGYPPYTFGVTVNAARKLNPALRSGATYYWASDPATANWSAPIAAPIGGTPYRALLTLQFYRGTLAAILIHWPVSAFSTVSSWRIAIADLHTELRETYDALLHRTSFSGIGGAGVEEYRDARGNRLILRASRERFNMSLVYLLAAYADAVDKVPTPKGNY